MKNPLVQRSLLCVNVVLLDSVLIHSLPTPVCRNLSLQRYESINLNHSLTYEATC